MTNTEDIIRVTIAFQGDDHEHHQRVSEDELTNLHAAMINGKVIELEDDTTTDTRVLNMALAQMMKVERR